jgi:predicted Zn-dependent protease
MRLSSCCAAMLTVVLAACGGDGRGLGLNLMQPQEENKLGADAYAEAKAKEKPCTDAATVAFVNRVASRLEAVANPQVQGPAFQWEVTVFESDQVNAWCLPGGKMAVYTAILPWCENEAALAAVLGHEIGHAVLRHGGERMTTQTLEGVVGQSLGAVLQAKGVSPTTGNLAMAAFGGLSTVGVMLPFSRHQETNADEFGLTLMAKAGYDPAEAVKFWNRFAKLGDGGVPSLLSDHPATPDREKNLRDKLPQAQQLYQAAAQKSGAGEPVPPAYRQMPVRAAK